MGGKPPQALRMEVLSLCADRLNRILIGPGRSVLGIAARTVVGTTVWLLVCFSAQQSFGDTESWASILWLCVTSVCVLVPGQ